MSKIDDDETLAYEENAEEGGVEEEEEDAVKGNYASLHSSGFKDFFLKPELMKAVKQFGYEHPSKVQQECIPQAIIGTDVICQAKSGMGKTAVFVLSILHQLDPKKDSGKVVCLCVCHNRELANQIEKEFKRFSQYFEDEITMECFTGGLRVSQDKEKLKTPPMIVVGTPGRLAHLVEDGDLKLGNVKYFVVDECDAVLKKDERTAEKGGDPLEMRRKVQKLHMTCPRTKQVLMFTATLDKETKNLCKKFMTDPLEVLVDDDVRLKLVNLKQFYVRLTDEEKPRRLIEILDRLEFNQVIIFVNKQRHASVLHKLLTQEKFPAIVIHGGMPQKLRNANCQKFKAFETRIMCATNVIARGMDFENVNVVINFDMPDNTDTYLHKVARAGRFDTKGLAISFVSCKEDADVLNNTQKRFDVAIAELPEAINKAEYTESK